MSVPFIDEIIKAYRTKIELDKYPDLTCRLCSQIMMNPCATSCGCSYCKACIEAYLNDNNLYCPGSNEDCKSEYLVWSRDIHYDPRAQRQIGKILVKCLNKDCDYRTELIKINSHMEVCDKVYRDCPFLEIGCTDREVLLSDMRNHLNQQCYIHSNMLMKCLNEVKTEIRSIKTNYEEQLRVQKEETDAVRLELESTKFQINDHRICFEEVLLKGRKELMALKEAVSRQEAKTIEMTENGDTINPKEDVGDQATLPQTATRECYEFDFKKSIVKISKKSSAFKKSIEVLNVRMSKIDHFNDDIRNNIKLFKKAANKKIEVLRFGDFIWTVDEFKKKMEDAVSGIAEFIWSECFYSHLNGYKLRLLLFPNGEDEDKGEFMNIYLVLMQGEYDGFLSWPCRKRFKIVLVNQKNPGHSLSHDFSVHTLSEEFKDRFQRPTLGFFQKLDCNSVLLEKWQSEAGYVCCDKMYVTVSIRN